VHSYIVKINLTFNCILITNIENTAALIVLLAYLNMD
jgi:hypothetical protein